MEDGLVAPLDAGFAFAEAGLAVFVVDLDLALAAAAFAAVCRGDKYWDYQVMRKGLAFLASFLTLVVFFIDGFFAAVVFLVAADAFFGAATDFFAVAALFAVVLDLPRAAFFVGATLVGTAVLAFLIGGWAFCNCLNNTP